MIGKKLDLSAFINRANKKHNNKYDYSLSEYINYHTKIKIICREHGIFEQDASHHLNGCGCPKCVKNYKLDIISFVDKANKKHNNMYDYSLVNYINSVTKVKIICKEHGIFEQVPAAHLMGEGCPWCYGNVLKTTEQFIKEAKFIHNDLYDYSLVQYKNGRIKVKIICKEHGIFEQVPILHLSGCGCPKCADIYRGKNHRLKVSEFIERSRKIHGDLFDYSLINEIISVQKDIKIRCIEHDHIFNQRPDNHLAGKVGCKFCNTAGISHQEKQLLSFIKENYLGIVEENNRQLIKPYEIDIYLPELKLAFEYNGLFWHNELNKPSNYHLDKTIKCEKQGIHLVQIYEDDWNFKHEIVKSRILNLIGKSEKVFARKCEIKEVSYKEAKSFLESNHLQGSCVDKIRLGLFYNSELVSVMTFGKLRKNLGQSVKDGSFELLRFCNKIGLTIVGGANKLFKTFINTYKPREVISYADRSWTMNNGKTLYDSLGFKLDSLTRANYFYINNDIRENRFKYRKDRLIKDGFDKDKTEHEIMIERELFRIYDSGQLKYKFG